MAKESISSYVQLQKGGRWVILAGVNLEEWRLPPRTPVATVSLISHHLYGHRSEEETLGSLAELKELCRTLGLDHRRQYYQKKNELDSATLLGRGKIEEIAESAKVAQVEVLIFDFELTASQMRNIKKATGLEVVDRCHIILEIFAKHAHSKEAKIQVEISRLEYMLPRLSGLWRHFTRQKGGIGLKGEGEQQLELDRRLVRLRIQFLKRQLKSLEKARLQQGKKTPKKNQSRPLSLGIPMLVNHLCSIGSVGLTLGRRINSLPLSTRPIGRSTPIPNLP